MPPTDKRCIMNKIAVFSCSLSVYLVKCRAFTIYFVDLICVCTASELDWVLSLLNLRLRMSIILSLYFSIKQKLRFIELSRRKLSHSSPNDESSPHFIENSMKISTTESNRFIRICLCMGFYSLSR